ncbi:DUF262 domain-containing protein [Leeuwenhoekiella sp. NPDC079379]|uniref:DUF262 domain-containing protein n=1 Tax=Leeuwenhoekiella sp. NPDC079379 TaxID=3364122 RepID=UPI0037C6286D
MNIKSEIWTIQKLIESKERIDPKPQYQRTPVWGIQKKKLLIDSILRGYDLPKFYLADISHISHFNYEVTDGQQRMRAIWDFVSDDENISYGLNSTIIDNEKIEKGKFKTLPKTIKDIFLEFELNISIIKNSDQNEIRALFARLQMGEKLNPVELRHATASNIGNLIFSLSENHIFFKECGITNTRYKHQDYLDHVISLMHFEVERNIKALDLKKLYEDFASEKIATFQPLLKNASKILDMMEQINKYKKGIFKNKWGFVDTFYLIYNNLKRIEAIKPKNFANNFYAFEIERKKHNRNPEDLIEDKTDLGYDKDLYDYIIAFNTGGALKENLKIRHRVLTNKFLNSENFRLTI